MGVGVIAPVATVPVVPPLRFYSMVIVDTVAVGASPTVYHMNISTTPG
jgi:hypothetical protein